MTFRPWARRQRPGPPPFGHGTPAPWPLQHKGRVLGSFAVLSFSYRIGARLGFGPSQRITHGLRVAIAAHVLSPVGARTGMLPGETPSLATLDVDRVGFVVRQLGYTAAAAASVP